MKQDKAIIPGIESADSSDSTPKKSPVPRTVVIVDLFPGLDAQLRGILEDASLQIISTPQWRPAMNQFLERRLSLLICDLEFPDGVARQIYETVKSSQPQLLPSLVFMRNSTTRPEADFLPVIERRDVLDKPFKHDQALPLILRRLVRSKYL